MKSLKFTFLLLLSLASWAGTKTDFDWLGFSKDGQYLAYETYGTFDGSAYPFSSIQIMDVVKNATIGKGYDLTLEDPEKSVANAREANFAKAKRELEKLGIERTYIGGKVADLAGAKSQSDREHVLFSFNTTVIDSYEIVLKNFRLPNKDCNLIVNKNANNAFSLELRHSGHSVMLQKDTHIPSSRKCPDGGYGIWEVRTFQKKVAIRVGFETPGPEGPNNHWLVVTGSL